MSYVTNHAARRMSQRGVSAKTLALVMQWGREIFEARAIHLFLGKKEVDHAAKYGVDLSRALYIHIFLDKEGRILTTYKDHNVRGRG